MKSNPIKAVCIYHKGAYDSLRESILQDAEYLCNFFKTKIYNQRLDIGYIDSANHSYKDKENELAQEINNFIEKI